MEVMENKTIPTVVDANQLDELLRERHDLRLLDVRTPAEYESVHIGSYNVPLDTLGEHTAEIRENVDAPVVLVCQSGSRSRKAGGGAQAGRYAQLHVLDGGLNGWIVSQQAGASWPREDLAGAPGEDRGGRPSGGGRSPRREGALAFRAALCVRRGRARLRRRDRHLRNGQATREAPLQPGGLRRGRDDRGSQRRRAPGELLRI